MRVWATGAVSVLAVGTAACGSSGSSDSVATVTQTKTVVERAPDSSASDNPSGGGVDSGGGSDSGGESWKMPDETGKDLQAAQDDIQALTDDGIFFTDSHDVSGEDRSQFLDRDWQVCTQEPAPGARITPDTKIDFGVVRVDTEQCP
jgi:hypothetical protein